MYKALLLLCVLFMSISAEERVMKTYTIKKQDLLYTLSMAETFAVGDKVNGTISVTNTGTQPVSVLKLLKLGRWRATVTGPKSGTYHYRGPKYKIAPIGPKDFIEVAPNETIEVPFGLHHYLPQEYSSKTEFDWDSVPVGSYTCSLRMESSFGTLMGYYIVFKNIQFEVLPK